jgi:hypothetical protein
MAMTLRLILVLGAAFVLVITLGRMKEVNVLVEPMGGTGSIDFTTAKVTLD